MTEVKEKFTPIDDSISVFIRQQKEYDEYLKKLRDEAQKGSPREKLKKGGKVAARGSLMDRPLYTANPHQKNINAARHILYARRSFKDGGSTNIDERIKESIDDLPDYAKLEPFDTAITEIKNRLDALEKKGKKKKKKVSKPE